MCVVTKTSGTFVLNVATRRTRAHAHAMKSTSDVGPLLRQLRLRAKLTQKQVADVLHVTEQAVSGWERGENPPSAQHALKLEAIYEAPGEITSRLGLSFDGTNARLAAVEARLEELMRLLQRPRR